jgi:hypothetical protein
LLIIQQIKILNFSETDSLENLNVYYFIRLLYLIPGYNLPLVQIVIDCNYWIANFYLDLVIKNQVHYISLIFQMDCFRTNKLGFWCFPELVFPDLGVLGLS